MTKLAHHHLQSPQKNRNNHQYYPKAGLLLLLLLLSACAALFVVFHIRSLPVPPSSPATAWSFTSQWQTATITAAKNCSAEDNDITGSMTERLRRAVTFLPLKDLRYADDSTALAGHTWFMSSMYDEHEDNEVQYQRFPSESSHGRLLCLKGRDQHDGAWNSYALAWPETLPHNATLMNGLTFVSYNHYTYDNIWHGLSAALPFVAWHQRSDCSAAPRRWVLYYRGELRLGMGGWLMTLMEATFGEPPAIEGFEGVDEAAPVCFEEAVVMRHNEGGMSNQRRMEAYDLMRCKARAYCNVTGKEKAASPAEIRMTMFMRTGARSFRNDSAVVGIFERECAKVEGCRLRVAYSNNLTFCDQVKVMRWTDILVSPHGAQLTNMFMMERNSSVMEFFPKGWLKLAGVGQYVYHWIASWSGMRHQGAWRDPEPDPDAPCPYPDDDRRCMSVVKNARIGFNETYFAEWARDVLSEVRLRKHQEQIVSQGSTSTSTSIIGCSCK